MNTKFTLAHRANGAELNTAELPQGVNNRKRVKRTSKFGMDTREQH